MYIEVDSVGELIKELRKKNNNLSVIKLAEKMHVSRQTIYYWQDEINQLSTQTLAVLLNVLGESLLIEDGKYKILKEKNMNNKKLVLDFANFNEEEIINKYNDDCKKKAERFSEEFDKNYYEIQDYGYNIILNMHWDTSQYRKEFCDEGILIEVEKDDKSMSIVIDKASLIDFFDFDRFIEDISNTHGFGVGNHIRKSIIFTAYNLGLGPDIFNCFKRNISPESIRNMIPLLKDFEEIVHNQLKANNYYFEDLKGFTFNNQFPLSIVLGICDEYSDDYIWIKLENEEGEERYMQESFETPIIADALEFIKDNFDNFDELFNESIE